MFQVGIILKWFHQKRYERNMLAIQKQREFEEATSFNQEAIKAENRLNNSFTANVSRRKSYALDNQGTDEHHAKKIPKD